MLERMTQMQRAGDVRWWYHDAERLSRTVRCEPTAAFPTLIDAPLDFLRGVELVHQFRHRETWSISIAGHADRPQRGGVLQIVRFQCKAAVAVGFEPRPAG